MSIEKSDAQRNRNERDKSGNRSGNADVENGAARRHRRNDFDKCAESSGRTDQRRHRDKIRQSRVNAVNAGRRRNVPFRAQIKINSSEMEKLKPYCRIHGIGEKRMNRVGNKLKVKRRAEKAGTAKSPPSFADLDIAEKSG